MPVSLGNVVNVSSPTGGATTSYNGSTNIVTTTNNEVIVVMFSEWGNPMGGVTSMQLDGVAMTLRVPQVNSSGASLPIMWVYDAVAATPGTHTVAYNCPNCSYNIFILNIFAIRGATTVGATTTFQGVGGGTGALSVTASGFVIIQACDLTGAIPTVPTCSPTETLTGAGISGHSGNQQDYATFYFLPATTRTDTLTAVGGAYRTITAVNYPLGTITWQPTATQSLVLTPAGNPTTGFWYPPGDVSIVAATTSTPWGGVVPCDQELVASVLPLTPFVSRAAMPPGDVSIVTTVSGSPTYVQLFPGAGFEVRIFDVAHPNNLLAYVPNPVSVQFEDTLSDVGAGQVTIETEDVPPSVFQKDNIWRISWDGVERFAFVAEQVQEENVNVSETHVRTAAGRGLACWLEKAKVYPVVMDQPSTPRQFNNNAWSGSTAAGIWQWLMLEAQNRGTATQVTWYNGWNKTKDSSGLAWTDVHNMDVAIGTDMLSMLGNLAKAVPFDWHMDPRFGFAIYQHMGVDRHGQIRIAPSGTLLTSTNLSDSSQLWTEFLVQDSNDACSVQNDATAINTYGRREQFANASSVVDATGRHDYAYQLLQQYKNMPIQRTATVAADIVGVQPYVNYQLGDIISVEVTSQVPFPGPDDIIVKARVVGIAMSVGDVSSGTTTSGATSTSSGAPVASSPTSGSSPATVHAEITLDFMFGQTLTPFDSSPSAPLGAGLVTIFADNGGSPLSITTSVIIPIALQVIANAPTYVTVDTYLRGQASTALTIQADVWINGNLIRSMKQVMTAGENTWSPTFVISSLPQGTNNCQLRLSVSTGTFAVAAYDLQHWYTGYNLQGGIVSGSTAINVVDTILAPWANTVASATPILAVQTPQGAVKVDSIAAPWANAVAATIPPSLVERIYSPIIAVGADDGSVNTTSSTWANNATTLEVGNDGTFVWGIWVRFVMPAAIPVGATISHAWLNLWSDQADAGPLAIIYGEKASAPTAPTTYADYTTRVRTTASALWNPVPSGAGVQQQSVDISAIIQELSTAYAPFTVIQLFVQDNSSPSNRKMIARSKENTNNQPPQLIVRWTGGTP